MRDFSASLLAGDKSGGAASVKSEVDPSGKGQHEAGAKLDAGKVRMGLVFGGFANALEAVAAVGTFGAKKYSDDGWKSVGDGVERYTDAMFRHAFAEVTDGLIDSDSEQYHAAQVAWNALARLELMLFEMRVSDG